MRNELKFRKNERRRRRLALLLAVAFHLVALAAISYQTEIVEYLPDVVKDFFVDTPNLPQA